MDFTAVPVQSVKLVIVALEIDIILIHCWLANFLRKPSITGVRNNDGSPSYQDAKFDKISLRRLALVKGD